MVLELVIYIEARSYLFLENGIGAKQSFLIFSLKWLGSIKLDS